MSAEPLDFGALSIMERVALLPPKERVEVIEAMSEAERCSPEMWLRPDQLRPYHDPASTVAMISGRGAGKTRVGGSWSNKKAQQMPGSIGHLIGRTVADVRDVMVRGDSGVLAVAEAGMVPVYIPSLRRLEWPNGTVALTFTSEKPAQLRGPQSHWSWVDEMAALNHRPDDSGATAWDNVRIGTRLGAHPQIFVTTTPKRIAAVRDLIHLGRTTERVSLHGASTFANRAHLSPEYLRNLLALYAGTALERQELYGELVEIVPGALWRPEDIVILADFLPWAGPEPTMSVIGVDPGLTTGGDATGIVTVRSTTEHTLTTRRAHVVADYTEEDLQPERWAARVVEAWRAERDETGTIPIIVAEKNAGGELVGSVIDGEAGENNLPVALVPSTRSKAGRAEAIVLAYRQGRVVHRHDFTELVLELTEWEPPVPGGSRGSGWSPNRLDALVIALRACLVDDRPLRPFGKLTVEEPSEVVEVPYDRWRSRGASPGLSLPWR